MIRLDDEDSRTLESLIDKHNLDEVVQALADICFAKAEHLQANWQDAATAKTWNRAGKALDTASTKV